MKNIEIKREFYISVFAFAYGAKALTALLLASRKWNTLSYADAMRVLLKKDTLRFGAFLGTLVATFRFVEALGRIVRNKNDHINHAIAGGVSGLALLIDSSSRRSTIALYIFIRALDVVGRTLTCSGYIPEWKYTSEVLFSLSNGPIMYALVFEPHLLPKSYYRWICNMGGITHDGLQKSIRNGWATNGLDNTGNIIPIVPCQPHYHRYV